MRGHSRGGLYIGRVFPIAGSTKQKLNSQIFTDTDIAEVDNFIPAICWTKYFLEAQGYNFRDNRLHQDNKSSILLENNGKTSKSKRTKYINVRYLFITYSFTKGNLSIVWCPTWYMISDYMTRLLQGGMFRRFRDQIMGVVPAQDPRPGKSKSSKTKSEWRLRQYNKL